MDHYDHSEAINQIIGLWDGEDEKERYYRLKMLNVAVQLEVKAKRCVSCASCGADNRCRAHRNTLIPQEYLYVINECDDFDNIPF